MRAYLEVIDGRYAGTTVALTPGAVCQVGSRFGADVFLPDDYALSPLHFALICGQQGCEIQDFSGKAETFVNGVAATRTNLQHGDWIVAGSTLFSFLIDGQPVAETGTPLGQVIQHLHDKSERLYVLTDAALDPEIEPMLEATPVEACDLGEGIEGMEARPYRPWLVAAPKTSRVLEWLVRSGWGKGRYVFFTSPYTFNEVADDFRHLLYRTQAAVNGTGLRFFDPRLLRVLMLECDAEQAERFFRTATTFIVESQLPHTCLEFQLGTDKVNIRSIRLSQPKPVIPSQAQFQEFFSDSRGSFSETMITCLRQHLPAETNELDDEELRQRIHQGDRECATHAIKSLAGRGQYITLSFIFGSSLSQNREVVECLSQPRLSPDDNLRVLVGVLNQRRG